MSQPHWPFGLEPLFRLCNWPRNITASLFYSHKRENTCIAPIPGSSVCPAQIHKTLSASFWFRCWLALPYILGLFAITSSIVLLWFYISYLPWLVCSTSITPPVALPHPISLYLLQPTFFLLSRIFRKNSVPQNHCDLVNMPNVKPILPPLKTPKSAVYPSQLHNGSTSSVSDYIKQEDQSTPITPPTAYTDFLKALTPVFTGPMSASHGFPKYLGENPSTATSPTSQPASAISESTFSDSVRSPTVSLPPPTPNSAAPSRKNFHGRRLRIQSALKFSPNADSPRSATPRSATTLRSPFSPSDWTLRYYDSPRSAKPVSVKQVVTRTVTYKRTQLEAPPKGKRRKCREAKEVDWQFELTDYTVWFMHLASRWF